MSEPETPPTAESGHMAEVMDRNIRALLRRKRLDEQRKSRSDRLADTITRFTGSMRFVYIHLVVFGGWVLVNLPFMPGAKFDPTFVILAMAASVEAIFLSTFVLISQNRMAALQEERAELNLQIDLLAEHEITRLISLVQAIAERMNIEEARNPELAELKRDVEPEKVLDTLEGIAKKREK